MFDRQEVRIAARPIYRTPIFLLHAIEGLSGTRRGLTRDLTDGASCVMKVDRLGEEDTNGHLAW